MCMALKNETFVERKHVPPKPTEGFSFGPVPWPGILGVRSSLEETSWEDEFFCEGI